MSTTSYRPTEPADLPVINQILADAFTPGDDLKNIEHWTANTSKTDSLRTYEVDGAIVGSVRLIEMGQYFAGKRIDMTGVAGVAVAPEKRASGVGRSMMADMLRELHDRGTPISVLFASTSAFYRKLGYETAGLLDRITVPMHLLPKGGCPLETKPSTDDDLPGVMACSEEFARANDGYLSRGRYVWDRIKAPSLKPARGYVFVNGDAIEGYIFHRQNPDVQPEFPYALDVTDLCAVAPDTRVTLYAYLRGFSSMNGSFNFLGTPAHPIVLGLTQQRIQTQLTEQWMLRITHLKHALEQRGYPRGIRAEFAFRLTHDLLPGNAGEWTLAVSDGNATLTPGGSPTLTLDALAMATMYTGFTSARDLRTWANLTCDDDATLDACDALFRGPTPSMAHMF